MKILMPSIEDEKRDLLVSTTTENALCFSQVAFFVCPTVPVAKLSGAGLRRTTGLGIPRPNDTG